MAESSDIDTTFCEELEGDSPKTIPLICSTVLTQFYDLHNKGEFSTFDTSNQIKVGQLLRQLNALKPKNHVDSELVHQLIRYIELCCTRKSKRLSSPDVATESTLSSDFDRFIPKSLVTNRSCKRPTTGDVKDSIAQQPDFYGFDATEYTCGVKQGSQPSVTPPESSSSTPTPVEPSPIVLPSPVLPDAKTRAIPHRNPASNPGDLAEKVPSLVALGPEELKERMAYVAGLARDFKREMYDDIVKRHEVRMAKQAECSDDDDLEFRLTKQEELQHLYCLQQGAASQQDEEEPEALSFFQIGLL